jgi:hypothetical protein
VNVAAHTRGVSHTYINILARWVDTNCPYTVPSDRFLVSLRKRSRHRVNSLGQEQDALRHAAIIAARARNAAILTHKDEMPLRIASYRAGSIRGLERRARHRSQASVARVDSETSNRSPDILRGPIIGDINESA